MKRRDFFNKSLQAGMAAGAAVAVGGYTPKRIDKQVFEC